MLIVGAGLSGIGAACHLRAKLPGQDLRDPRGARRDRRHVGPVPLPRHPLGLRHVHAGLLVPARGRTRRRSPTAPRSCSYIRETARDHGVDGKIRFHHRVVRAEWSTARRALDGGGRAHRHRRGGAPDLRLPVHLHRLLPLRRGLHARTSRARERFAGRIVHPQHWPEDLDYAGKRVVVIGSGATAVTLVPAMAEQAAHVTMLQRSPSYVVSLPARDPVADALRRALPAKVAYPIVRWKNVLLTTVFFQLSRRAPRMIKALIRKGVERRLPRGYDVDTHFKPRYDPWDQRVCLVPDGDLFQAIRKGQASDRHRPHRDLHREGPEARVGRRARGRRDRHRHRAERADAGRHGDRRRRSASSTSPRR